MKHSILLLVLLALAHLSSARLFNRCSLARELSDRGLPRSGIANWVCIVQAQGSYDTASTGPVNWNGSREWGLFRINDRYWCNPQNGQPSDNSCGIPCTSLTIDDIGVALRCAQQIQRTQGLAAWAAWNNECGNGANVRSVDDCFN